MLVGEYRTANRADYSPDVLTILAKINHFVNRSVLIS